MTASHHSITASDLDLLSLLTRDHAAGEGEDAGNRSLPLPVAPHPHPHPRRTAKKGGERRPPVDPLMVAAAASSGPQNTRNHYLHSFFPQSLAYSSCDGERRSHSHSVRPKMESRQAPRHIRLLVEQEESKRRHAVAAAQEQTPEPEPEPAVKHLRERERSLANLLRQPSTPPLLEQPIEFEPRRPASSTVTPPLQVQCRVRTRIPTPHGHIFLHLYTNNHDSKEHLAFVADHAQMASTSVTTNAVEADEPIVLTRSETSNRPLPFIRSNSLDSKWHPDETDDERIIRGAYVGRLSATSHVASTALGPLEDYLSTPPSPSLASVSASLHPPPPPSTTTTTTIDPPLVRIHSECFTGETIGSQRCDCGEQLDEAFRLITQAGRGVVVYLRQEGRGIGLLEKMRAYNLQDLGHDTVTANLMLGHGADLRTYGIAGAILRDLGVSDHGVRLLTNNPDKIAQIEKEGVRVAERVAMVPRSWILAERAEAKRIRHRSHHRHHLGGGGGGGGGGGSKVSNDKKQKKKKKRSNKSRKGDFVRLDESVQSLGSTTTSDSIEPSRSPSPSTLSAAAASAAASGGDGEDDYPSSRPRSVSGDSTRSDPEDYYYSSSSSSEDDDDDDDDDEADGRSESSTLYNLRHSGVGMIGRSTTHSPELEKYLRTKIERMGHMLVAPPNSTAPSSSAPSVASSTATTTGRRAHPLSESTTLPGHRN